MKMRKRGPALSLKTIHTEIKYSQQTRNISKNFFGAIRLAPVRNPKTPARFKEMEAKEKGCAPLKNLRIENGKRSLVSSDIPTSPQRWLSETNTQRVV
jgi:hypothetical protein